MKVQATADVFVRLLDTERNATNDFVFYKILQD